MFDSPVIRAGKWVSTRWVKLEPDPKFWVWVNPWSGSSGNGSNPLDPIINRVWSGYNLDPIDPNTIIYLVT